MGLAVEMVMQPYWKFSNESGITEPHCPYCCKPVITECSSDQPESCPNCRAVLDWTN